jgi:hypothetical protein
MFREDRFTIWPIALACGFPIVLILLWAGPFVLAFVGAPILMMVWASSALLASVFAFSAARVRLWRRALSVSVLPLATFAAIATDVWAVAIETGETIHFHVMRRSYLEGVAKLPSTGDPRFVLWQWGGFVVGHGVVYDESDELRLPLSERSAAWKKRVENTEIGACGVWGTPLGDHFYLVRTGC